MKLYKLGLFVVVGLIQVSASAEIEQAQEPSETPQIYVVNGQAPSICKIVDNSKVCVTDSNIVKPVPGFILKNKPITPQRAVKLYYRIFRGLHDPNKRLACQGQPNGTVFEFEAKTTLADSNGKLIIGDNPSHQFTCKDNIPYMLVK